MNKKWKRYLIAAGASFAVLGGALRLVRGLNKRRYWPKKLDYTPEHLAGEKVTPEWLLRDVGDSITAARH